MIAAKRRIAVQDLLLVAFSVVVIVLSVSVTGEKQRTVSIRDASGHLQRYSLAANDPRLAKLESELAQWSKGLPETAVTLAKWHVELADFYIGRTQSKTDSSTVVQASFANRSPEAETKEASVLRAEHAYWTSVREQANQVIAAAERKCLQRNIGSAPIVLGDVTFSSPTAAAFGLAGLAGLATAALFAGWMYFCPAISLVEDASDDMKTALPAQAERPGELRLSIPRQWIRVHQPASVVARRVAYLVLVVGAFVCLGMLPVN